jgi:hypothetical protein
VLKTVVTVKYFRTITHKVQNKGRNPEKINLGILAVTQFQNLLSSIKPAKPLSHYF